MITIKRARIDYRDLLFTKYISTRPMKCKSTRIVSNNSSNPWLDLNTGAIVKIKIANIRYLHCHHVSLTIFLLRTKLLQV